MNYIKTANRVALAALFLAALALTTHEIRREQQRRADITTDINAITVARDEVIRRIHAGEYTTYDEVMAAFNAATQFHMIAIREDQ